jgi:hypothetical protein
LTISGNIVLGPGFLIQKVVQMRGFSHVLTEPYYGARMGRKFVVPAVGTELLVRSIIFKKR